MHIKQESLGLLYGCNPQRQDVLIDLCNQREYLRDAGPHLCCNAPSAAHRVKVMMAFARCTKLPVLSCVDARLPQDIGDEFAPVEGRVGPSAQKLGLSLLPDHVVVDSDNFLCVPLDILTRHQQAIFSKRHRDAFTNPKLDRLLTEMPAHRFVVMGVALESAVRTLILGLLHRGRRVALLIDACGCWSREASDMALRQMTVKGCDVLTVQDYIRQRVERMPARDRRRFRRAVA